MTNKFESKCLQKFYVSSKLEKECYRKTTCYLEQPSCHFCQHFMRRTTQQTAFGHKLGESTENNKALLFFSDKATIQSRYSFHWSHYAVVCEMINFRVIWSVNEIVLFNGFLSDFVEITSCAYTNTTILFNLGSVALGIFTSISENNMHMHFLDLSGFIAYVVSQMYLKVPPPPRPTIS